MSVRSIVKNAVFAAAVLSMNVAADNIGVWDAVEVGQNETQLLTKALSSNELYDETITTRMCFLEIHSIKSQVVSGTKYKYEVEGCKLADGAVSTGECGDSSANCVPSAFSVTVFEQPWTSTIRVMAIDAEAAAPAGSMAASNETISAGSAESSDDTTTITATTMPTSTSKSPVAAATTAPSTTPAPSSAASSLPGAAVLVMATGVVSYVSL